MSTSLPVRPFKKDATATEQEPVPHASVAPAPRSHVRTLTVRSSICWAKLIFVCFGNASCFSNKGPIFSISTESTSSTYVTVCGTPMRRDVIFQFSPSTPKSSFKTRPSVPSIGISLLLNEGLPMLMVIGSALLSAPNVISGSIIPAGVSTVNCFFSIMPLSYTYLAKQRMPFPHISASLPSELMIRIRTSATRLSTMTISPSAPIPVCRLHMARASTV